MTMRRGIVVAVHPEDHSVDLVMADDGSRLVGVQVMTPNGSTRSGTVDLPAMPDKKDKWDITQRTGQDMLALVATVGRNPVVTGFLFPQVNQMTHKDPKLRVDRHQSDVTTMIDGDGNFQWTHPSGTYIRIGETPDAVNMTGKNADASSSVDRNTGRAVNVRVGLAGGTAVLTIAPNGAVTLTTQSTFNVDAAGAVSITTQSTATVDASGPVTIKSPSVTLETPTATVTGNLVIGGSLSQGGAGGGNATFAGGVSAQQDVTAGGVSLMGHTHPGDSGGTTGPPA